jgi:hypothetical protein
MKAADVMIAKADIDAILAKHQGAKASIAFGFDLYREFARQGWLKMESFTAWGTGAFPMPVPAYRQSHFAYLDWNLPEEDFLVGPDA